MRSIASSLEPGGSMNVVSLMSTRTDPHVHTVSRLVDMVAQRRHARSDAFWYKENGEMLCVLHALDWPLPAQALAPYERVGETLWPLLRFFPQYYRLILGLSYDLNALTGNVGSLRSMAEWVEQAGLATRELSDLLRAEADFLVARALNRPQGFAGHNARLQEFCRASDAFRLPDRAAAYSLTHMVFYASDYGRNHMVLDENIRQSLIHAGIVAWLDHDLDILSEVVLALRFCGAEVPAPWGEEIMLAAQDVWFSSGGGGAALADDFHEMLMLNWAAGTLGGQAFEFEIPPEATAVHRPIRARSALQDLSAHLFAQGDQRRGDWALMRWRLWPKLSAATQDRLAPLEDWPEFTRFFEGFARVTAGGADL